VIDRIPSRWDHHWSQEGLDFGEDDQMMRPVTPPALQEDVWDPYRMRDVEVCY